ncbi:MAG: tetratricopeptide repeat protein [Bacillota bacterium]
MLRKYLSTEDGITTPLAGSVYRAILRLKRVVRVAVHAKSHRESSGHYGIKDRVPVNAASEYHIRQGQLYLSQKLAEQAIESFRRSMSTEGANEKNIFWLGMAYQQSGETERALGLWERGLKNNRESGILWKARGNCLCEVGRYPEAVECLLQVYAYQSQDADVLNNLGFCWFQMGDYHTALSWYEKALVCDPADARTMVNRGMCLKKIGRAVEAVESFKKAVAIGNSDEELFNNIGVCLVDLERYTEAEIYFTKALRKKPDLPETLSNLASCLVRKGCYREAIEYYDQALNLSREDCTLWSNAGFCLMEMAKYRPALVCYQKALELDKNNQDIWYNLAFVQIKTGNYRGALKTSEQGLRHVPGSQKLLELRGLTYDQLGEYSLAVDCYNRAWGLE